MEGWLIFNKARSKAAEKLNRLSKWHMYAFGYVLPLLLSAHPLIVAYFKEEVKDGYFREDACWLDDNYIFAFEVPGTTKVTVLQGRNIMPHT